jgi:twin arginine-targeting protein translocase, TatA/E family
MPSNLFSGWHLVILLVVILLLFGAAKLPALAKSMGQSARIFKGEMKAMKDENGNAESAAGEGTVASTAAESRPLQTPAQSPAADPASPGSPDVKP